MSIITLAHPTRVINGTFLLPFSKSVCNRLLILRALSKNAVKVGNISTADDSIIMQQALKKNTGTIDVKNAGTCMRFLTAYYACTDSDVILHGNSRMHERPIGDLVEALKQIGADIDYIDREGYAPLRIKGKRLKGGTIKVDAGLSSQYISALMLIAPILEQGLTIELQGNITSLSYIQMTERVLFDCGIMLTMENNIIDIPPQSFKQTYLNVEADWSAASYWYAFAALSEDCRIELPALTNSYLQGDIAIANYMERFGVQTHFENGVATLTKSKQLLHDAVYDMSNEPDLVPAMAVALAVLNVGVTFENIANLRIKESNRIEALENELSKCGFNITSTEDALTIQPATKQEFTSSDISFSTYGDHRIAMAFAALALVFDKIKIENPEVVEKSYPEFWQELKKAGFVITKADIA